MSVEGQAARNFCPLTSACADSVAASVRPIPGISVAPGHEGEVGVASRPRKAQVFCAATSRRPSDR